MLKSGGRTDEVPVMGMEEWPSVDYMKIVLFGRFRIASTTKRVAPQKGVVPYAKGEERKNLKC